LQKCGRVFLCLMTKNAYSNYKISWTQRKTGRRVTHLTFEFSEKQLAKP